MDDKTTFEFKTPVCYKASEDTFPLCDGKVETLETCKYCDLYKNELDPTDFPY